LKDNKEKCNLGIVLGSNRGCKAVCVTYHNDKCCYSCDNIDFCKYICGYMRIRRSKTNNIQT